MPASPAPLPAAAPPPPVATVSPIRRYRWPAAAALLAVAAMGFFGVRAWLGPQVAAETVLRRPFVQTVVASGHVEAPHRVDVGAQITGTVLRVPVAEGQVVKAGDLLVALDAAELNAVGRQADVAVVQAESKLRQLQEVQAPVAAQALRQAQSNLANARSALARSRDLFAKGFIGQAALDDVRKAAELADAQMRSTQTQLEGTGPAGSDRALALADVAGAQANAQAARARAGYTVLNAPVGGTLIARNVEVGDVVQPGKVLMTLSPGGRTQLVVEIDEKNLHLLALGQGALVSADAYPAQQFAATLVYINPGVNALTGAVEVKLEVPTPPPVLKQDMTVSVDIEVARRASTLVAPASTVHDADGAAPWVLRVDGGHALRRPVQLGLRSAGWVEVVGGLAEGDRVISSAATVAAGARVRVAGSASAAPASAP